MGEPKEPGDEPVEVRGGMPADMADLIDAWDERYLDRVIRDPALSMRDKAEFAHALAKLKARKSKRMPARASTPPPLPTTVVTFNLNPKPSTTESSAAAPAPREDQSCPPVEPATSNDRAEAANGAPEADASDSEPPSRGVKAIREARASRVGRGTQQQ